MFFNILIIHIIIWNIKLTYQDTTSDVPKIKEFIVKTFVANHFAETTVLSKVENDNTYTKQTTFSVVYPEGAFITGFSMKIDGNIYNSFVKEAEEAEKAYGQPISSDQTEGYAAVYTRNSNRFAVNVDVKPKGTVIFNLTYEELLQREKGQYEIISYIHPGQLVQRLSVEVEIKENNPFLFVRTPPLRSGGNALIQNNSQLDPQATVKISNTSAAVKFHPDLEDQLQFACAGLGNKDYEGFAGQFVVQYEIERDAQGGETLFQDDIFVNFCAPSNIKPLLKHIVFVLDTSGSMRDTHIAQLKEGMASILSQMDSEDLFSIVQYGESVYLWDSNVESHDVIPLVPEYGNLASQLEKIEIPEAMKTTPENVEIAKKIVNKFNAEGGTNTIGALEVGLYLVKLVQEKHQGVYLPILIFLTDGLPSVGVESTSEIISLVLDINSKEYNTPIYSLCFGNDADWKFLQVLSLSTKARAVRIYVSDDTTVTESDVAIQLKDFYDTISSPVLTDIIFGNLPPSDQVTQLYFPIFTNGSEIVIAGKGAFGNDTKPVKALGKSQNVPIELDAKIGEPLTHIERIWAYLTIKQLLEEFHATSLQSSRAEFKKQAVELALNYNLTTSLTSLIVTKPNGTFTVIHMANASSGIFPETINDLPMCKNVTDWIATNFGTFESTTTDTRTEATTTSTDATTTFYPITTTTPDPTPDFTTDTAATTSTTDDTSTTTTTTTDVTTTTSTDATTTATTTDITTIITATDATTTTSTDVTITTTTGVTATITTTNVTTTSTTTNISSTSSTASVTKTIATILSSEKYKDMTAESNLTPTVERTPVVYQVNKACRDMAFGCCHDGVTAAVGYNFSGSDPIPRSESCSLPVNKGICNKYKRKWAYKFGECRPFWYSGCGGNDNRFVDEATCKRVCVNINGPAIRQHEKTCKEMVFGCCPDGSTVARGSSYLGCDPIPRSESCSLKHDKGVPCSHGSPNSAPKWTYVSTVGECRQLHYLGCEGNDNRFASKMVCEKVCIEPTGPDRCKLPIFFKSKRERCSAKPTLLWFYEKNKKRCIQHEYSGCSGNANKFSSKQECEELCIKPFTEITSQEICLQEIDRGPCSNYTEKWGFNITEGRCVFFWYGGCGGNDNAFDTEKSCSKTCLNTSK